MRSTCSGCGAQFHDAAAFFSAVAYQEESGRDYRAERDAAYVERNRCVAGLAAETGERSEPVITAEEFRALIRLPSLQEHRAAERLERELRDKR